MISSEALKNTSSLIVKSNRLVNAEYRITPLEMKIIYLMSMQIKQGDEDFKTYYLRICDFKEDLGLRDNKALYTRMIDIVNRLMQRVIKIEDENGDVEQFHFITYSKHKSDNGTISIRFVPELKPHLLELKAHFTAFYDTNVLMLRSSYSMRIYEFLKQYEAIGKRRMKVDEIKKKLEIGDKYRSYYMFKKKVILQAEKDLKKHCDIYFTYDEIKDGRKVDAIDFFIQRNRKAVLFKKSGISEPEEHKSDIKALLAEMGLTEKQIIQYVEEEGKNPIYLQSLIEETRKRFEAGKVKNPAAYLIRLIESGAKGKSDYEKKVEQNRRKAHDDEKVKAKKFRQEKAMVEKLLAEFEVFRTQQKKKLTQNFNDRDWEELESYVKTIPGSWRKGLLIEDKINRQADNIDHWIDIFIGSKKLPRFEEGFIKWAYDHHRVSVKEDQHHAGQYMIVGTQSSLFNKESM